MAWGDGVKAALLPGEALQRELFGAIGPSLSVEGNVQDSVWRNPANSADIQQKMEMHRLRGIESGQGENPALRALAQGLQRAEAQGMGAVRGVPMANAAAQGRMMRGAQSAIRQRAPQMMDIQRLQSQAAARGQIAQNLQNQERLERERINREVEQSVADRMRQIEQTDSAQQQVTETTREIAKTIATLIFSDKRLKKNIKSGDKDIQDMLNALKPTTFEYKGKKGKQTGILAQDLKKTPAGSGMGVAVNDRMAVDPVQATGPMLAALADLHKRIESLEGGK